MRAMIARQDGQALILVLALMALTVPMITGALTLASTLTLDSRSKTRILMSQYSGFGAEQSALHTLLASPGSSTTTYEINGVLVTTTIIKLSSPPRELPTYVLESRLDVSKGANPTSTSANGTTTYTITVRNPKNESVIMEKIIDILSVDFSYVASSTVMRDPNGAVISTADPVKQIYEYRWTVPSTALETDESMTLSFQARTTSTPGIYCNEAYALPGGIDTLSGKEAEVTVAGGGTGGCKGGVVSVTKTVKPALVYSGVTTTYAFVISIENKGDTVVNIKEIKDIPSGGFEYVALSASSTDFVPGEPETSALNNFMVWKFADLGLELPTSTTWHLDFQTQANLSRGIYPNKVDMVFAGVRQPSPSQADFCEFGDTSLTLGDGASPGEGCMVGSNGDVNIGQGSLIEGGVMSLGGTIHLNQQTQVGQLPHRRRHRRSWRRCGH